jgi:hypothetical protein
MALGWLIGLGPVGWAILGVPAIVAGAVAAWKTNFGGFRDFVLDKLQSVVDMINKVRKSLGMTAIEFDVLEQRKYGTDWKTPAYRKPPVLNPGSSGDDNRQQNFYIQSTDPEGAANEVSKKLGGSGMDKYAMSRDPRLQTGFAIP